MTSDDGRITFFATSFGQAITKRWSRTVPTDELSAGVTSGRVVRLGPSCVQPVVSRQAVASLDSSTNKLDSPRDVSANDSVSFGHERIGFLWDDCLDSESTANDSDTALTFVCCYYVVLGGP